MEESDISEYIPEYKNSFEIVGGEYAFVDVDVGGGHRMKIDLEDIDILTHGRCTTRGNGPDMRAIQNTAASTIFVGRLILERMSVNHPGIVIYKNRDFLDNRRHNLFIGSHSVLKIVTNKARKKSTNKIFKHSNGYTAVATICQDRLKMRFSSLSDAVTWRNKQEIKEREKFIDSSIAHANSIVDKLLSF